MKYPIKNYLRAIWLWADIWDICWWHNTQKYCDEKDYYLDCKLAWDVARGIWLKV